MVFEKVSLKLKKIMRMVNTYQNRLLPERGSCLVKSGVIWA